MPRPDAAAIARDIERPEDHVVRDILQARIVGSVFSERVGSEVILKGGLAMRAAHGSRRFTKDIDLHSGPGVPPARTQSLVRQAIKSALSDGILTAPVVSEPKQTDTVQRWKVRGHVGETLVTLTVELSRRDAVPAGDRVMVEYRPDAEYGERPVMVETFTPSAMAAAKVLALTDHRREAPRDLYDLDLLITSEVEPPVAILARVDLDRLMSARAILSDKIEKLDYASARTNLLDYLPADEARRIDEDGWATLQARSFEVIDGWLGEAITLRLESNAGPGMCA